ncbi:MAG: hypothetical protein IPP40_11205 [bacterium]|nr:hypothetical protein [bacterium]
MKHELEFSDDVFRVIEFDDYVLVLTRHDLHLVSLTDSTAMINWTMHIPGTCGSIAVNGNKVYVVYSSGHSWMTVYDLEDPMAPDSVGNVQVSYTSGRFVFADSIMYTTTTYPRTGLVIYDASDPGNIHEIGLFDSPGPANNLARLDSFLYVGRIGSFSGIWDIASPFDVNFISHSFPNSYETCIWNNRATLAASTLFCNYDMSDPLHPATQGCTEPLGWAYCAGPGVVGC